MRSFRSALERIKGNVAQAVPASLIRRITQSLGLVTRERQLTPVVTTHLPLCPKLHLGHIFAELRSTGVIRNRFQPMPVDRLRSYNSTKIASQMQFGTQDKRGSS